MERRIEMPDKEWTAANEVILEQLAMLPAVDKAATIHIYLPIVKRKEIDTIPFIRRLLMEGRRVVVPITHFEKPVLDHVLLNSMDDLKLNKWGIPEPVERREVPVENIDVVIVPMVGGDYNCNRLGNGKGYYDRFLSEVDCPKIGLLHQCCLVDEVPVDKFDVPLNQIITEQTLVV